MRATDAEEGWLLVAPEADGWFADGATLDDLPGELQQRLRTFLCAAALEWIDAEEAYLQARQAIVRGRRQLMEERPERSAIALAEAWPLLKRGGGVEARELTLSKLPG